MEFHMVTPPHKFHLVEGVMVQRIPTLSQTTFARSGWSVGIMFGSYLDVLRELGGENYTIRIATSRSF